MVLDHDNQTPEERPRMTDENLIYQTEYYRQHPEVLAGFGALARHRPEVIDGYLAIEWAEERLHELHGAS
jgi:hypothetical protein